MVARCKAAREVAMFAKPCPLDAFVELHITPRSSCSRRPFTKPNNAVNATPASLSKEVSGPSASTSRSKGLRARRWPVARPDSAASDSTTPGELKLCCGEQT